MSLWVYGLRGIRDFKEAENTERNRQCSDYQSVHLGVPYPMKNRPNLPRNLLGLKSCNLLMNYFLFHILHAYFFFLMNFYYKLAPERELVSSLQFLATY